MAILVPSTFTVNSLSGLSALKPDIWMASWGPISRRYASYTASGSPKAALGRTSGAVGAAGMG
ncbi:hypothetical protein [Edwardsiella tarda]|uniref:hypothetical protein n=1 Tax=Edwardsiella tarda TaxID=636 RepID=UPI00351C48C7